jgi:hypothetical protein
MATIPENPIIIMHIAAMKAVSNCKEPSLMPATPFAGNDRYNREITAAARPPEAGKMVYPIYHTDIPARKVTKTYPVTRADAGVPSGVAGYGIVRNQGDAVRAGTGRTAYLLNFAAGVD